MLRRLGLAVLASVVLTGLAAAPSGAAGVAHPRVVSENPIDSTPHAMDGTTLAILPLGGKVYVGGTFSRVRNAGSGTDIARRYLFAYDAATGKVDLTFKPAVNGVVETIVAAPGGGVIIGGAFTAVNGVTKGRLAKLTATGAVAPGFSASTNATVFKAVVRGNRLFVGGKFTSPRSKLAEFDATTGALRPFNVPVTESRASSGRAPFVVELDVNWAGTRMVLIGNFAKVGGQSRVQIAMIDLTTNSVSRWSTQRYVVDCKAIFDTYMRDVDFSPDGSYFAVVTTGAAYGGSLCDATARWETNTVANAQPTWHNCTGGDTLHSVAVTGVAVYVGGHQRWLDNCGGSDFPTATAVSREGIGAIHPVTGKALPWNPGRPRGVGVQELVSTSNGLFVGHDTTKLGGEYHARLGFFPL